MVEDRDIIMASLVHQRRAIEVALDRRWYPPIALAVLRPLLARLNAEIARRCWSRLEAHAALMHSPLD